MEEKKMKSLRTLGLAGLAALALGEVSGCVPRSTESNEVGVNYCKFWCVGEKLETVAPGQTIFLAPVKNDWYTLTVDMQTSYMNLDKEVGDRPDRDDLIFKTKEGNDIGQDIVLTWKVDPTKAQMVVEEVGTDIRDIREKYVRPLARSIVRDYLNKLTSSEFYESQRRFEETEKAKGELKEKFAQYGIIIDNVTPQDYRFIDAEFQNAINAAKNAGQDKGRYEHQIEAERQKWLKELETQKGLNNQSIAAADGEKRKKVLDADSYLIQKQQEAAAITTEKSAEAEGIIKMRQAMASSGGDTAVLMEYVKGFTPEKIVVLPCESGGNGLTVNRLDLNQLITSEAVK